MIDNIHKYLIFYVVILLFLSFNKCQYTALQNQTLIIRYNQNEKTLDESLFESNYIQNIELLEWSHSNIEIINDMTFSLMPNLKYLYLNNNKLKFISNNSFNHVNSKLELLDLSNNPIENIYIESFSHLNSLKYLYLRNTSLVELNNDGLFRPMKSLFLLDLSYLDCIKSFDWNIFIYNRNLNEINLSNFKNKEILFDKKSNTEALSIILKQIKYLNLNGINLDDFYVNFLFEQVSNQENLNSSLIRLDSIKRCSCKLIKFFVVLNREKCLQNCSIINMTKRKKRQINIDDLYVLDSSTTKLNENSSLSSTKIINSNLTRNLNANISISNDLSHVLKQQENFTTNCSVINGIIGNQNQTTIVKPVFDTYTIIAICSICLVLILAMITALVFYKLRIKYLLKRQINQFKRIDAQLGLDRIYHVNYDNNTFNT
jgi:hypothetical protein